MAWLVSAAIGGRVYLLTTKPAPKYLNRPSEVVRQTLTSFTPYGWARSSLAASSIRCILRTSFTPCLPRLPGGTQLHPSITLLNMSGFFKRAKKKAKGIVDSLRPPSRQGRSPSPASPHTSGQSTPNLDINSPATPPLQPQPAARLSLPVQSGSSESTPLFELDPAQPVSSPTHATPAYARPSTPPSALSTTGSVVYELLKTIGDASDMFLPLEAAVVGVLRIWDVCEVRSHTASAVHPTHSRIIAYRAAQSGILGT